MIYTKPTVVSIRSLHMPAFLQSGLIGIVPGDDACPDFAYEKGTGVYSADVAYVVNVSYGQLSVSTCQISIEAHTEATFVNNVLVVECSTSNASCTTDCDQGIDINSAQASATSFQLNGVDQPLPAPKALTQAQYDALFAACQLFD